MEHVFKDIFLVIIMAIDTKDNINGDNIDNNIKFVKMEKMIEHECTFIEI